MELRFWKKDRVEPRYRVQGAIEMDRAVRAKPSDPSAGEKKAQAEHTIELLTRERDALGDRLASLERMLADPEGGQNAILYYRLRAIWRMCSRHLAAMAKRFTEKYVAQSGVQTESDLPTDKRRAINLLLIAMAQEYYLLFSESQIAEMARQAALKPVESVHFGLAEECLEFGRKARELAAFAYSDEHLSDTLRQRAKYLHQHLRFEDKACIPRLGSLNSITSRVGTKGESLHDYANVVPVNVLALDYWNLKSVLLD
ncbi:MAG: hypothetical protein L0I62_00225 [Gammaproteobacteria bacterium]|nr:hypothetical protein [Gammaproteobacteria bacterium]